MKRLFVAALFLTTFLSLQVQAQDAAKVENGKKVKFSYTLKVNNEVVESTEGKEPLEYTQGAGMIIPGLESQLEGMKVGDQKIVTVAPKDAYGEVFPEVVREFPASSFPADFKPAAGMVIEMKDKENGQSTPGVVTEVKDEKVKIDFNHPLAGKTLEFDVKVVGIETVSTTPAASVTAAPVADVSK